MKNTISKLITKSFRRLLDKGIHRGFITYEELGKSLGKRHYSQENIEKAFLHIFDNKVSLVEKKSDYKSLKRKESSSSESEKSVEFAMYNSKSLRNTIESQEKKRYLQKN